MHERLNHASSAVCMRSGWDRLRYSLLEAKCAADIFSVTRESARIGGLLIRKLSDKFLSASADSVLVPDPEIMEA